MPRAEKEESVTMVKTAQSPLAGDTRITRIEYKPGRLRVDTETPRPGGKKPDKGSFTCGEEPIRDLPEKLQELRRYVVDMLEISCGDCNADRIENIRVDGVAIAYRPAADQRESSCGPRLIMGVMLSASLSLQEGKMKAKLRTPRQFEESTKGSPADPDICLAPKCAQIVSDLVDLSRRYLDGERLQPKLPGLDGKMKAAGEREE